MAKITRTDLRSGDVLEIGGLSSEVETIRGRGPANGASFWTLAVPGGEMRLTLRSAVPYADLPFELERIAVGNVVLDRGVGHVDQDSFLPFDSGSFGASTKSLCGAGDYEDAACYMADAAKWANIRATAGVMSIEGSEVVWCTGVSVSPRDYVLTTESCLPDTTACRDAQFVFGLYLDGCGGDPPLSETWTSYRCTETVASSPFGGLCEPDGSNLDFALHGVAGRPANTWGYVDPSSVPISSGDGLYIVQHAGGRPLEITHGDGADVVAEPSVLRYFGTLDTESSSVGAPIFAEADDRLVGLHHCGGCSTPGVGNRGIPMPSLRPAIVDFLCSTTDLLEPAMAEPPRPLSGNGDGVLDPGEIWSFVPALRNPTCLGAGAEGAFAGILSATADFAPAVGSASIEMLDTTSTFGDIADGATISGTPIRFRLLAEAPCAGEASIEMISIGSAAGSFVGASPYLSAPVGEVLDFTFLEEGFDAGLPADWTLVDGGDGDGPSATWTTADPGSRQLLDPPFAIVDSEHLGPGSLMDEELITAPLDTTTRTSITLEFQHDFRFFDQGLSEKADVEVRSSATGGAWTALVRYEGADSGGLVELDLTPYSASDLQIRFRYWDAEWEWWWGIDDVRIAGNDGPVCFTGILVDGFESGDLSAWSAHQP